MRCSRSESIVEGVQAATDKQAGDLAAAMEAAGAEAGGPTPYEPDGAEYPGEPSEEAMAMHSGGEDITMEDVMGTKTRKQPAPATTSGETETVESKTL